MRALRLAIALILCVSFAVEAEETAAKPEALQATAEAKPEAETTG
jgi:hypothetical protein